MKSIIFLLVLKSILGHILTDLDNDNKRIDHLQQVSKDRKSVIVEGLNTVNIGDSIYISYI